MLPSLEVLDNPLKQRSPDFSVTPALCLACVVTHAQSGEDAEISLSDSVLMSPFSEEGNVQTEENNILLPPHSVEPEEPGPFLKNAFPDQKTLQPSKLMKHYEILSIVW